MANPLMDHEIKALKEMGKIRQEAVDQMLVDDLMRRKEFDAVTELAHHLPVNIVSEMVGLPEEGRANMLDWASASFDSLGAYNDRYRGSEAKRAEALDYVRAIRRDQLWLWRRPTRP